MRFARTFVVVLFASSFGAGAADSGKVLRTAFSIAETSFDPVIAWDAVDVPDGVEAVLLWNTDFTASRVSTRALAIEAGRILPVDVAGDRNWIGTIRGIALVLRGSFSVSSAVSVCAAVSFRSCR